MRDWKSTLKADPTGWLLEEDNPSVRYSALTDILERGEYGDEVRKARAAIMEIGLVPKILASQKKEGYWGRPEDFYIRSKYKGTVWNLILLAELGAGGGDNRIKNTCEFILENSQDRESGGFSYIRAKGGEGGAHSGVIPCLTANMVWSLIRFGYLEDSRVKRGIEWIVKYQRFDDGVEESPQGWPYDNRDKCWGTHTCHMGVVKALKAFSEIPADERSTGVKTTIQRGSEYMLGHRIYRRSHDPAKVSKPEWLKFGFPLMWNTDALEILEILGRLGYKDSRMQDAVDLVMSKQDELGKWKLDATFTGRYRVSIEQVGKPSKWITLNALKALKLFYS
ncbi:MAG: nitrogen fixation protein NifH [Promethearchaeati archaeon SRVP18_Atabeyarchaeia-1]